jgi:AGCS family alanine or glycine:cation symporter
MHFENIGVAFKNIFVGAFTPRAVCGASCGIAIKEALVWGLKRSAFSNEAGLGSAGIAHAAADTKGPVQQGLFGIFEVFADTLVICTLTGLTIITSGIDIEFGKSVSSELITSAFATVFGTKFASLFVTVALFLFALSTLLGWALYGSRCVEYLFGVKVSKIYQIVFSLIIIVGTTTSLEVVWNLADTFNGLMAIPNFIALFTLSGVVAKLTKEHFAKDSHELK